MKQAKLCDLPLGHSVGINIWQNYTIVQWGTVGERVDAYTIAVNINFGEKVLCHFREYVLIKDDGDEEILSLPKGFKIGVISTKDISIRLQAGGDGGTKFGRCNQV